MRPSVLALVGLLALSTAAAAQEPAPPEQLPVSRFAITPFLGVSIPYSTGTTFVFTEEFGSFAFQDERGGSAAAGLELEARVAGPVSLLGSFVYSGSTEQRTTLVSEEGDVTSLLSDTPEMWMGRLAVSYRLPEPRPDNRRFHPAGMIFVGPALVRTNWADGDLGDDLDDITHWGINFGVHAATRLGSSRRVALHLGLEDYLTFWNTDRLVARETVRFGRLFDEDTVVDMDFNASNLLLVRAGLSFRFR